MQKNKKAELVVMLLGPIGVIVFLLGVTYKALFWWLEIWSQRSENAALRDDIQANLYFLYTTGEIVKEPWLKTAVLPFDYASVCILNGTLAIGSREVKSSST